LGTNFFSILNFTQQSCDPFSLKSLERHESFHIGKSSIGWCFSLHVIPEIGIHSFEGWVPILMNPERFIVDEYQKVISFMQLYSIIHDRKGENNFTSEQLAANFAIQDASGLLRHEIGGNCIAHGPGTYDLMVGYFR